MKDLLVWLTTWRRPDLLSRSLPTLRDSLRGLDCDVQVTINECDPQTTGVVLSHPWINKVEAYANNRGLLPPFVAAGPDLWSRYRYVLLAEDDCGHRLHKSEYLSLIDAHPELGAVSGYACPVFTRYHGMLRHQGRRWELAAVSAAVDLLVPSSLLLQMGPWPANWRLGLDSWIFLYSPRALSVIGRPIAISPGAAEHWGAGRSTWSHASEEYTVRGAEWPGALDSPAAGDRLAERDARLSTPGADHGRREEDQ